MTDDWVLEMVQAIRAEFPDCAITLSLGEKKYDTLKRWKEAGADRYLLRHETGGRVPLRETASGRDVI